MLWQATTPGVFSGCLPYMKLPPKPYTVVPNHFGARDRFHGRQFFHQWGVQGDGFGMIQTNYIYYELYFYYYYISSTSENQALDLRG